MPNYVDCDLFVRGQGYQDFVASCVSVKSIFDFNNFIPTPYDLLVDEVSGMTRLKNKLIYGYETWYEFRSARWGTKWNACGTRMSDTKYFNSDKCLKGNVILINFITPWNPPKPIIHLSSILYPELKFTLYYYEQGNRFKGKFICKGGIILVNESYEYDGRRGG